MILKADVTANYVKAKVRLLTALQSSCTSVPYLVSESGIFATNHIKLLCNGVDPAGYYSLEQA